METLACMSTDVDTSLQSTMQLTEEYQEQTDAE
jgi:hypothetical protein